MFSAIKKSLLTLCLCALLCMAVTASASEVSVHSHPICEGTECTDPAHNGNNHGSVTFEKALTSSNGVLYINEIEAGKYKEGNAYALPVGAYYLNGDLELKDTLYITGNVTLCVNGHDIKVKDTVVEIGKDGSFTLCDCRGKGSLIADTTSGRGVAFNSESTGNFAMYGGSVTGNSCNSSKNGGGVYISTDTAITLSGNIQIKDNYKGSNSNKNPSNIYLARNKTINVAGPLTGSSIGVTTAAEPGTGSNVTFANGSTNTIATGIFTPDTAGVLVGVAADGTSAYLYKCSHVYDEWAYDEEYHWKKCTNVGCDSVEAGSKIAHTWDYPADYNNPKTCVCGATTGTKLSAYYYYFPAKTEDTPVSPKAGDPGVLLYAGLALASLTGLACTAKKRH